MRNFSLYFAFLASIFLIHGVRAGDALSPEEQIITLPSKHQIQVIYENEYSRATKLLLADLTLQSLSHSEKILGLKLNASVEIHFDNRKSAHNGLTTLIPRNRILIYTRNPEVDSSLALSKDYIFETLLHEWAHFLTSSQRSKLFSTLHFAFGNLSSPNGLWPRWIHEGLAVWVENHYSGRANSGIIDFDLRRLREYESRTQKNALQSSSLDGNSELEEFNDRGDIPYHFGYLFWRAWFNKYPHLGAADFIYASSSNLGLSFRKTFKELGSNIDTDFEEFKILWRQKNKSSSLNTGEPLAASKNIRGPFQNFNSGVAWVEYTQDQSPVIKFHSQNLITQLPWEPRRGRIFSVQFLEPEPQLRQSYVLAGNEEGEKFLYIFDNSKLKCKIPLKFANEIQVQNAQTLLWIAEQKTGVSEIFEATLNLPSCQLEKSKIHFQSEAFHRISYLRESSSSSPFAASLSTKRNSYCEQNLFETAPNEISGILNMQKIRCSPQEEACWIGQLFSPDYLGPILLKKNSQKVGDWLQYQLPLSTGSYRFALSESNKVFIKQSFWEREEILKLDLQEFFKNPPKTFRGPCIHSNTEIHDISATEQTEFPNYSPTHTLVPQFWIPALTFYNTGYFLGAQTFYSDIRSEYSGASTLGYSSDIHKILFNTNLKTPALFAKTIFDESHFEIDISPVQIYDLVQIQGHESLGMTYVSAKENLFNYTFMPILQHSWGANNQRYPKFHRLIPGLFQTIGSFHSIRKFEEPYRASKLKTGISLLSKVQWIKSWDLNTRLNIQQSLGTRSAVLFNLDHAYTHEDNFPISFFEWGGRYSLSHPTTPFLNRGFQPRFALARSLIRAHLSSAFNIWNPQWALSWNRIRLDTVDLRIISESLSYDSLGIQSSNRVGNNFFSTIGAQTQFFGQTLGYVAYHLSLGIFQGLGPGSETRAEFGLGGFLDL